MDLNHVAAFVKVVESGSFTTAAAQLGLPKSSVSRIVSRLEEELGVRLLHRTTRKLHVTDAGGAYFERARAALQGLEEAASTASNFSSEPRGVVRFAAPSDAGTLHLTDIIARFRRKYPLVQIDIAFSSRYVDLVGEGFDLALRGGKLRDSSLVARKVGSDSLGVFASTSYLRGRARPKRLQELAQHECLLFHGFQGRADWQLTGPNGEERVTVHGSINADELTFLIQAAMKGLGVALLPTRASLLATEGQGKPLVRLLPEYSGPGADVHLVMPSRRFQPASVVAFCDFLHAELSKLWARSAVL